MKKYFNSIKRFVKNIFLHLRVRIYKLSKLLFFPKLWKLLSKGIMPSFEHLEVLKKINNISSLIDCGSNKGQFAIN